MRIQWPRRKVLLLLIGVCLFVPIAVFSIAVFIPVGVQPDGSILLPSGQTITPAGTQIEVNDRPVGIAVSPDNVHAAVVTGSNFQTRALHILDLGVNTIAQTINLGGAFAGIAYSPDGNTLYIGGGTDNNVKVFKLGTNGEWSLTNNVSIPGSEPSGLSLSPAGDKLYVALNRSIGFAIVDTATLTFTTVTTGSYPFTTVVTPNGGKVYVSNWGGRLATATDSPAVQMLPLLAPQGSNTLIVDPQTGIISTGTVSVYDTALKTVKSISVGLHPAGMAVSPDGSRVYVTNSNSDTVSIINTATDTVDRSISVKPYSTAPLGSAPNAITVSADGQTLYVANGANNAVAIVQADYRGESVRGFIPVGWFPMAVALTNSGDRLLVGNGYGFGSIAPVSPGAQGRSYSNRMGEVSLISSAISAAQLKNYTKQVMQNNLTIGGGKSPNPITAGGPSPVPANVGDPSPIKHIIYIIKENRTYDQVFGDMRVGNGDPNLAIFGNAVTPNHHAMAAQFELFDNFYGTGDQSGLGHQWTDESYPTDYTHRYGNGRNDFAGTNAMTFAPTGFLWTNATQHGKTVRIYGEFANQTVVTPSSATWNDFYNSWKNHTAGPTIVGASAVKSVQPLLSPIFPGYDLRILEQIRADLFLQEFNQSEANNNLPNLIVLEMPIDHTVGTSPGSPTPAAMVADNDLAIGRVVDAVSHSKDWASTAFFITEDDTQDGVDHVDGHRNPGLIISPYTRRGGFVDSTLYTSANMFRTIEQILGLPPLNQYDTAAQPMYSAFVNTPDLTPFTAVPNQTPLDQLSPLLASIRGLQRTLALASMKMDFSEPDEAPADLLNRVIWHSVKGYDVPYPTARKGVQTARR